MAGTVEPIAALTDENRGPINTILSVFLPVTSVLFATVRMALRKQKFSQFERDDIVFGAALCFGILTSILSHFCVRAGLGRHQDQLNQSQIAHYFKISWATQLVGVLALALAKSSLALLYKRVVPNHMGPRIMHLIMPMIAVYTVVCIFLVAFQCGLPHPWVLSPSACPTHGNVYYPVIVFNMLTDALLAVWIFPIIRSLHTKAHTKSILLWLFGSRLVICVVDIGRMIVVHKALRSEDQTRSQLLWFVLDQIVVHLSINHATLPRIQAFLSHLQIGAMSAHVHTSQGDTFGSRTRRSAAAFKDETQKRATAKPSESQSTGVESRPIWSTLYTSLRGRLNRTPSISEQPLNYQQEAGIEMSTMIYSGKGEPEQTNTEYSPSAAISLSRDSLSREENRAQLGGVTVRNDIDVKFDKA